MLVAARRQAAVDVAEVFVEERTSTSIRLDDRKRRGADERRSIAGRVSASRSGTTYGYAYANRLDRDSLLQAAEAASAALAGEATGRRGRSDRRTGPGSNRAERAAERRRRCDKVGWLRELDEVARGVSPEVVQVAGIYVDSMQRRLIATSDGRWVREDRPRIRLVAQVVATRGDVIQTGCTAPPRAPASSSSMSTRRR